MSPRLPRPREPVWRSVGTGTAIAILVLLVSRSGLLGPFELDAFDRLLAFRADAIRDAEIARDPGVVLVTIGEDEIRRFGHPLSDDTLAEAIERLRALGARGIGVDLYRDLPVPPGSARLAALARADARLVFVAKASDTDGSSVNAPAFAAPDRVGIGDLLPDLDGVVRRALLFAWDPKGEAHLTLGLRVALLTLASDTPARTTEPEPNAANERRPVRIGEGHLERLLGDDGPYTAADDGDYQIVFDRPWSPTALPRIRLGDLLQGSVPAGEIGGRAVLIGNVSASVRDDFRAPPATPFASARPVRGVELHGALVEQLLRVARRGDALPVFPGPTVEAGLVLLSGLAGALAARRLPGGPGLLAVGIGGSALLSLLSAATVRSTAIVLPLGLMAIAFVVAAASAQAALRLYERRRRTTVERLLVPHVAHGVRAVLATQEARLLRGEGLEPSHATGTILFADIEGWGEVTRSLPADTALAWLSGVLGLIAAAVEDAGGTVEDFAGDGVKACFGIWPAKHTPPADTQPADAGAGAALHASLHITRALHALATECAAQSRPVPRLRIGIHTGDLVIGSVGTKSRLKLATVGSTVNVAARLEALARPEAGVMDTAHDPIVDRRAGALPDPHCTVLVSDATMQRVAESGTALRSRCRALPAGEHALPDLDARVKVWRLVAGLLVGLAGFAPAAPPAHAADSDRATTAAERDRTATDSATRGTAAGASNASATAPTTTGPARAAAVPTPYVPPPPARRVAWRRVGGATRAAQQCDTQVTALVPAEHVGLTVRAAPTLVFTLARATACPTELVVNDPRALAPLLELRIPGPLAAGTHRVALREHGLSLEPDLTYTWFVAVVADPARRSGDLVAGGGIRRIVDAAAAPAVSEDDAALLARGVEFARSSLWYDAVADLSAAAEHDLAPARDALETVLAAEGLELPRR